MPTDRERKYYQLGFQDGAAWFEDNLPTGHFEAKKTRSAIGAEIHPLMKPKPKRKLSAWNKYVKANSKKPRFRYRNGKLNLKKMAIAFRKTPAGRKKRR